LLRFARNDVDGVTPRKAVILVHAGIQYAAIHRDPPHDRGDHDTPLWSGRDGSDVALIWGSGKAKSFSETGLTQILKIRINDLPVGAQNFENNPMQSRNGASLHPKTQDSGLAGRGGAWGEFSLTRLPTIQAPIRPIPRV
jgi:hypothetical protein